MGFLSKTYDRYRTGTPRLEDDSIRIEVSSNHVNDKCDTIEDVLDTLKECGVLLDLEEFDTLKEIISIIK